MEFYGDKALVLPNSKRKTPISLSNLSAGELAEMCDDYDEIDFNEYLTRGKEGFMAYKVTGDSMVSHILPGYIVLVDPYCDPEIGDIVVSRVNGKNNVKILDRKANRLYLVPKNKKYDPIEITKDDDFTILGVVKGLAGRV